MTADVILYLSRSSGVTIFKMIVMTVRKPSLIYTFPLLPPPHMCIYIRASVPCM